MRYEPVIWKKKDTDKGSLILTYFLFALFFLFLFLLTKVSFHSSITLSGVFTDDNTIKMIFPTSLEEVVLKSPWVKISSTKEKIDTIYVRSTLVQEGTLLTEVNLKIESNESYLKNHIYELVLEGKKESFIRTFIEYGKEVVK